jgi:hypothetical protein
VTRRSLNVPFCSLGVSYCKIEEEQADALLQLLSSDKLSRNVRVLGIPGTALNDTAVAAFGRYLELQGLDISGLPDTLEAGAAPPALAADPGAGARDDRPGDSRPQPVATVNVKFHVPLNRLALKNEGLHPIIVTFLKGNPQWRSIYLNKDKLGCDDLRNPVPLPQLFPALRGLALSSNLDDAWPTSGIRSSASRGPGASGS